MPWVIFIASATAIVIAATQLAKYGDIIAIRTRLGGMFVGVLLMAGATSLPEVLTTINAVSQSVPNLAAGNLLGSNMFNMVLLALIDIAGRNHRILRKAALKHALSGSLSTFMIALVILMLLANIPARIGWVGVDSILIIMAYVVAIGLVQRGGVGAPASAPDTEIPANTPSLRRGLIGFAIASAALVLITPYLVSSSADIAEITGLGTSFVGTTLVAIVTSLPELVTTLAALKIGADDMAIGNLFGSNMFNMFALGLTDLFYTQGRFLDIIDPSFLLVGVLGLVMTSMALIGNLAKLERRLWFIEIDALALILVYFGGLWLLYTQSVVP